MVDFNIKNYLVEETVIEKDPHRFDNFYGDVESKPETEQKLFFFTAQILK